MSSVLDHPLLFAPLIVLLLFAAGGVGTWVKATREETLLHASDSLKTLEGAVLGLLGLLLGFSFAMAVNRYDLRKQLEVEEANAIGTTWLRTDVLSAPARSAERQLLRDYVPVRLSFLSAGTDRARIAASLAQAADLQSRMWAIAAADAAQRRDPVSALFLSTLNDAIDATEKRTAAFENRIPAAAWALLLFMGAAASALVGTGASRRSRALVTVLPLVVASAMTLILDLDSPRAGFVRIQQNSMARVAAQIASAPR